MVRLDIDYKLEQMDQQIQALKKDIQEMNDLIRERMFKAYAEGYREGYKDGRGPEAALYGRTR